MSSKNNKLEFTQFFLGKGLVLKIQLGYTAVVKRMDTSQITKLL